MDRTRRIWPRLAAPAGLAVALLFAWEFAVRGGLIAAEFLPAPTDLAGRFITEVTSGPLLEYTRVTLLEALLGTLIAVLVAVPVGYLIARVVWVDLAVTPYVTASQAIPAVALAPLLALWIGYGLTPIAILCAIVAFFPMLVTTVLGVRALPSDVIEAARLDGAHRWQSLLWVEAPLAMPSVLAGLRAGTALSITGAVVGEFTMGGRGLGMLLTLYRDANDTEGLFATLVMLVILAVGLFTILRVLEAVLASRSRARTSDSAQTPADDEFQLVAPAAAQ
jgi:NitT/TauT family transport system permease protein